MAESNSVLKDLEKLEGKYLPIFFSFFPSSDLKLQNIFSALLGQKEKTMSEKVSGSTEPETHTCPMRKW